MIILRKALEFAPKDPMFQHFKSTPRPSMLMIALYIRYKTFDQ